MNHAHAGSRTAALPVTRTRGNDKLRAVQRIAQKRSARACRGNNTAYSVFLGNGAGEQCNGGNACRWTFTGALKARGRVAFPSHVGDASKGVALTVSGVKPSCRLSSGLCPTLNGTATNRLRIPPGRRFCFFLYALANVASLYVIFNGGSDCCCHRGPGTVRAAPRRCVYRCERVRCECRSTGCGHPGAGWCDGRCLWR